MPPFAEFAPSRSCHIESHPAPGIVVHVLEVAVPEQPTIVGPGVRIVANRQTETITIALVGKQTPLVDDDGA